MHLTPISTIIALSSLSLLAESLPLVARWEPLERRAATYSVVAVDGGSSTSGPTETATQIITQSADPTTLPPTTQTVVVSKSESNSVQTVLITITPSIASSSVAPTLTPTSVSTPVSSSTEVAVSPSSSEATSTTSASWTTLSSQIWMSAALASTSTIESATTTYAQSTPINSYDNGQWHTSYPAWNASSVTLSSSSSTITPSSSSTSMPLPTLSSSTEDSNSTPTLTPGSITIANGILPPRRRDENGTTLSVPQLPKLPLTAPETLNSTGIPSVVVSENLPREIPTPILRRGAALPTAGYVSWNASSPYRA